MHAILPKEMRVSQVLQKVSVGVYECSRRERLEL